MRGSFLTCVALLTTLLVTLASAADLPRYALPVGRQLTYLSSSESTGAAGQTEGKSKGGWQITVVRENPDGSRRVLIRSTVAYGQGTREMAERVTLGYADVFSDGRVLPNATLGVSIDLSNVMPRLPADDAQATSGWSLADDVKLETSTFAPIAAGGSEFAFSAVRDGVMSKIYATTSKSVYHFDRARGIMTSSERESSQNFGLHQKSLSKLTLDRDETRPAGDMAPLSEDYDRYFTALDAYRHAMESIGKTSSDADQIVASAKTLIEQAREKSASDTIKSEFDKILKSHDRYAASAKEEAAKMKEMLGKPAADWSTTDIDGHPVKLQALRGKVVVMDFWYRGCGWCMYAMPQIKQLSKDYKDKPVAVLGMNTDRQEADARFVIDTMGLNYPTIKAEGIPEKYGVQGFPTLIIVDPQGVIRDVHVGYSPDLRQSVGKKIDELLEAAHK